jgi:Flp pilus assembly protein TadB
MQPTPLSRRERRVLAELEQQLPRDMTPAAGFASPEPRLNHRARHTRLLVMVAVWALLAGLCVLFQLAGMAVLVFFCATVALAALPLWYVHRHISRAEGRAGDGPAA